MDSLDIKNELTQDEINAILAGIETDDYLIQEDTKKANRQNAQAGRIPPSAKGRKRTEDWKDAHRIPCSEDKKEKIGNKNRGRELPPPTEEAKRNRSVAAKGNKNGFKAGQISWNANIDMDSNTRDKISETKTKYTYHTPKGIFYTKRDMLLAFPEYTTGQIERFTAQTLKGFSRTLKPIKDS
jgi:hypothetical protein